MAQTISFNKKFIVTPAATALVSSASDTLIMNHTGFANDILLATEFPFQLSTDGVVFKDTILVSKNTTSNIPVYVRLSSSQTEKVYRNKIVTRDGNFTLSDKVYLVGTTIDTTHSMRTATWNIKWFGSPTYCNCDTSLSRSMATEILKELDLDVIALQEIVSISQLQKVVSDLGPQYSYVMADYCSQIQSSSSPGYATAQKQAYIINTSKLQWLNDKGLLKNTYPSQNGSSSPYYYFASGRWPYLLTIRDKKTNEEFHLVNMHGKAFGGSTEHNRRAGGALKMTDELNQNFTNTKTIVLGDYNDLLVGAISTGFTVSPYNYMLQNGFTGLTLPSMFPGQGTYIGSSTSLIDNYVISNNTAPSVIGQSTIILKELELAYDNFKSTLTDHLPVLSHFRTNVPAALGQPKSKNKIFQIVQPLSKQLHIIGPIERNRGVQIFSMNGKKLLSKKYPPGRRIKEHYVQLTVGIYIVRIESDQNIEWHKWVVI